MAIQSKYYGKLFEGCTTAAERKIWYQGYLQSRHWRTMRQERFAFAGRACEQCGSPQDLQVHHVDYDRLGCEAVEDLRVMCRRCHELEHALA